MGMEDIIFKKDIDNSQCKKCLYRAEDTKEFVFCGFMFYTGKRRPCDHSPNCTAFVKTTRKERRKLVDNFHDSGGW